LMFVVVTRVGVVRRLVVVTRTIAAVLPPGIIVAIVDSIVAVRMCMVFFFVSLLSIATLNPGGLVASLRSIDGDRRSRVRAVVFHRRAIVGELIVQFSRPVDTTLVVGTKVVVVWAVVWGIRCRIRRRRIRMEILFGAFLCIALAVCRIDGERTIASCILVLGDVAGSQGRVVERSHAVVIGGRVCRW